MLFDWFTVGAQTLNFLILVWLMKRFLYKPVIDAIDAREKRIALALLDAALKQTAAGRERDEFHRKNEDFDHQREELSNKVKDEIKTERQRLLDEVRQAANDLRVKRQGALTNELNNLHQDIAQRSRKEVFSIAQKVLTDLAGTTLEERMCEVFTRRLRELDPEAKEGLAKSLKASSNTVLVRSTFELPAARQVAIHQALNEAFSSDIQIRFDTTPDLIGGIELTANGWKVAWNIADFLASMEQSISELIKQQSEPAEKPAAPEPAK